MTYLLKRGNALIPFAFSHNLNIAVLPKADIGTALLIINGKNSEASMYLIVAYNTYMTFIHRDIYTEVGTNKSPEFVYI